MAEDSISILSSIRDGINKLVPGSKAVPGGVSTASISEFAGKLKDLAGATLPVITGFTGIGKQGQNAYEALEKVAKVVPAFGGVLGDGIAAMQKGREQIAAAGKQGIGDNNFLKLQSQVAGAATTIDQHTAAMKNSQGTLNSLSGTASGVSDKMLALQRETQENPLGMQLKKNNAEFAGELNAATLIMASNSKANLKNKDEVTALAASSAELAAQIDQTSKITGQSRDAIRDELQNRMKSAESQLAMNQMNEQQRQQYVKTQAALVGMGPSINDLATTIASGGRLSEQNKTTLQAMGPAAGDFQKAIRMQQMATTEAQKQQADAAMAAAKAKINEWQNSKRFADIALQGSGAVAEQMKKSFTENQTRAGQMAQQRETGGTGVEAAAAQQKQAENLQQGKTAKGTVDPGQVTGQIQNEAVERARVNSAGAAKNLSTMNDEIGRIPNLAKKAGETIDMTFGKERTQAAIADRNKATYDKVQKTLTGEGTKPNAAANQPANSRLAPIQTSRADGSLGATGKLIEDFGKGTPAMLHGKEGVITENQLSDLMGAAKGGNAVDSSSLDFIAKELSMLNSSMAQLVSHTIDISEASSKTARHSGKLTGNRAA